MKKPPDANWWLFVFFSCRENHAEWYQHGNRSRSVQSIRGFLTMPESVGNPQSSCPTFMGYLSKVIRGAHLGEQWRWLWKVAEVMIELVSAAVIGLLANNVAVSEQLYTRMMAVCLTLLGVAGLRGTVFFFYSIYKLHCEQVELLHQSEKRLTVVDAEKDALIAERDSKPLEPVDAKRYLNLFAKWLSSEAAKDPLDVSTHRTRYLSIYKELIGKTPPVWEETSIYFTAGGSSHSGGLLGGRAGHIIDQANQITGHDSYKTNYKPPQWLKDLDA